jgi:hypothetical protein
MSKVLKRLLCMAVLGVSLSVLSPNQANAQGGYWNGYWNWYDNTYRPYYGRYYGPTYYSPPSYYNNGYYGQTYYTPYYGRGVQVGPLRFGWW